MMTFNKLIPNILYQQLWTLFNSKYCVICMLYVFSAYPSFIKFFWKWMASRLTTVTVIQFYQSITWIYIYYYDMITLLIVLVQVWSLSSLSSLLILILFIIIIFIVIIIIIIVQVDFLSSAAGVDWCPVRIPNLRHPTLSSVW